MISTEYEITKPPSQKMKDLLSQPLVKNHLSSNQLFYNKIENTKNDKVLEE